MTRLAELRDREALDDEGKEAWDAIASRRNGRVGGPFGILLHSPIVAERVGRLGDYLRFDCVLDPADREFAISAVAREFNAAVEWAAHSRLAREAGVSDASIEVLANRGDLESLTDAEADVARYVRELLGPTKRVSDATYEAAHSRFGDRGVVELTALIGYYALVSCILDAFELEPGPDAPRLPEVTP